MIGDARDRGVGPHRLADEQAIHARQHQIENDQIGGCLPKPGQDVAARRHPLDAVARLLEVVGDERGNISVVFDDQDLGHEEEMLNVEC